MPRMVTATGLLIATLGIASCDGQPTPPSASEVADGAWAPLSTPITTPIAIESIRLTAAGHFVDLRYRVRDPESANELLGPGVKPRLIDEATGVVMEVPMTAKLGELRQTQAEQRPDRSYFVFFSNSAGVHAGSRVTAELGEARFTGLTIE
jgi:hypothetical protein